MTVVAVISDALLGVIIGGAIGIVTTGIGAIAGYKIAKMTTASTERAAKAEHDHAILMANDARIQERVADVYRRVAIEITRLALIAERTRSPSGGAPSDLARPSEAEWMEMMGLTATVASEDVIALHETWRSTARTFFWVNDEISVLEYRPEPQRGNDWYSQRQTLLTELERLRRAVDDEGNRVLELIRLELRSVTRPPLMFS